MRLGAALSTMLAPPPSPAEAIRGPRSGRFTPPRRWSDAVSPASPCAQCTLHDRPNCTVCKSARLSIGECRVRLVESFTDDVRGRVSLQQAPPPPSSTPALRLPHFASTAHHDVRSLLFAHVTDAQSVVCGPPN